MRYVKQEGIRDCGIACLFNIIKYYRGNVSMEKLRELTETNENGTSIYNIIKASKSLGLDAHAYKCNINDLATIELPIIAYIKLNNFYHFVIIKDIDIDKISIFDPIRGDLSVSLDDFNKTWQSVIITFKVNGKIVNENSYYYDYLKELVLNNKKLIIILLFISLLISIINIIFSITLKQIITSSTIYIVFIFSLFILKILSVYINNKVSLYFNNKIDNDLSSKVYRKLFSLPYSYYHNRPIGDLISKINDLYYVKDFLNLVISSSVIDILLITFISNLIIFISFKIFIVLLICSAVYFIFNLFTLKDEREKLNELKDSNANNNALLMDNILGIDTIKNLNINEKIVNKQIKSFNTYLSSFTSYNNYIIKKSTILSIISYIPMFTLLTSKINSGNLIMLYYLLMTYFNSLSSITILIRKYMDANLSFKRLNNLLNYEIKEKNEKNITSINNIKFNNMNYKINNKILLNNFSLDINKGDSIYISGENGIGKSTIFKLLNKSLSISDNNIYINSIDINKIKDTSIKNNICYVSQDEHIFNDTIKNNILMYKSINNKELNKVLKVTEIDKMLKNKHIDLNFILDENGHNLSGGERQKILLARTLIRNIDFIIFDETTSEMDTLTERKIINNIKTEYNKTMIFISHRDSNIDLFNKKVLLKGGKYERIEC